MSTGFRLVITACLVAVGSSTCSLAPRKVRLWVGANGAGGVDVIDRATNASCSESFLGNLSRYHAAVDSLGFEVWTLSSNGSSPLPQLNDGSSFDHGLAACAKQINGLYPNISLGICGATTAGALGVAASNPEEYTAALDKFTLGLGFRVDEYWTDFEIKDVGAGVTAGTNKMHALMQASKPTFRYAGCEPRDAPYFSESCAAFVEAAPGVTVQAANTYWSTTVSGGWYGGFATLFQQEVDAIGKANVGVLSPAICPACATGADANNNLTQAELYRFMDVMCDAGVKDASAFTFFEIVQGPGGVKNPIGGMTISDRYFEALSYFQSGKKGLIVP